MDDRDFSQVRRDSMRIRHAWMLDGSGGSEVLRQAYIITWHRKQTALVTHAVDVAGNPEPIVIQRWVPAEKLRPVEADPNRAYDLR